MVHINVMNLSQVQLFIQDVNVGILVTVTRSSILQCEYQPERDTTPYAL